jgi:hypothetical protein
MPIDSNQSLIRAYTGNPDEETELNRGRIQLAWQDENRSGLRIISYDRTDEENSITRNWTFTGYGSLELPEGGTIAEGVVTDNPTIELIPADPDVESQKLVIKGGVFEELDDYHLHLTTGALNETSIILGTDEHNVRTTIEGKIQITTPGESSNVWEFGTDGITTFPDGTTSTGATVFANSSSYKIQTISFDGSPSNVVSTYEFGIARMTIPSNGYIFNEGQEGYWALDGVNSRLQFPNLARIGYGLDESLPIEDDLKIFASNTGSVYISANGEDWQFGNDGTLTFPDATVQTTAFTGTGAITFTGNEIEGNTFGGTGTIITKTVDNTGDNYSTGGGSIGFLNFGADGTIQNVKAGWTVTFASGVTRTVSQDAFQPLGTYWNISFDSAYIWSAGDVMPVTFSSPDYVAGTDPQVTLTAGTESWIFNNTGDLTLPAGGNIVDSTGVNQTAQRVEGTWTVTTGTNTYNFTVPMDGTYVMWVKGNIPNGIITWNATVSVSNSNVPAIGTQYAWNYTGGGSPILLTAMPDQIRGTTGTISTDATYAGTTSNRFDFTIANTSGESQTVYYGYTKI